MITIIAGVLYVCGFYEASRYMLHDDKLPPDIPEGKARAVGVMIALLWPIMTTFKMAMDLVGEDRE